MKKSLGLLHKLKMGRMSWAALSLCGTWRIFPLPHLNHLLKVEGLGT